ncbi:MAG: Pyridoxal 5'-phosphate synthase (glutamine hydrolyzing), glutaminase subunit, partial [uncultured Solirubrobacteraceae bacterium]
AHRRARTARWLCGAREDAARARGRRARGARPGRSGGPGRARHPWWRVDDDDARDRARGARRAAAVVRQAGVRDVRRADHARPRAPRDDGHRGAPQRVRAPGALLRGGPRDRGPRRAAAARRVHPRAVDRGARRGCPDRRRGRRPRGRRSAGRRPRGCLSSRAGQRHAPARALSGDLPRHRRGRRSRRRSRLGGAV